MSTTSAEAWASGDAYEPYIGRWSRLVAREFLDWLTVAPAARWLDVGCGTGALTQTILATANPTRVDAVDSSADYVAFARDRVRDPRVTFAVADAQRRNATLRSATASVHSFPSNETARST